MTGLEKCARGLDGPPVKSDDPFMIATVPLAERSETSQTFLGYLLLGDLRLLLEERPGPERDRWLVATLDMLLMSRPRSTAAIDPPAWIEARQRPESAGRFAASGPVPFDTLQRLRDRIVHRAPCDLLVQELQTELREWSQGMTTAATMSAPE